MADNENSAASAPAAAAPAIAAPAAAPAIQADTSKAEAAAPAAVAADTSPAKVEATDAVVADAAKPTADEAKADAPKVDTILGGEEIKPAAEAEAVKPADGEANKDGTQSDEPAPLPAYDAFTLPEGITLDGERVGEFNKLLGSFELDSKVDHAKAQAFGQQLIDKHVELVKEGIERYQESETNRWVEQKKAWVKEFDADPTIGGNRKETSIAEAKSFIKTHGGSPEDVGKFFNALKATGADAHPDVIRFILNVKNSSSFRTPQQLAAPKPVPQVKSKIEKRYGSNS